MKKSENRWSCAVIIVCLSFISLGYVIFYPVFAYYTPHFSCLTAEQLNNQNGSHEKLFSRSAETSQSHCESWTNAALNQSSNSSEGNSLIAQTQHSCNGGWVYDLSLGNTVVTEFDLVCASAWKRPFTQSLFMIGMLFGSLVSGPLSDRYGRKIVFLTSFLLHVAANGLQSLAPNWTFYVIMISINGAVHIVQYTTGYVLAQELAPGDMRLLVALMCNLAFTAGYALVPMVAYLVQDWRWLIRVHAITFAAFALLLWFVPESEAWKKTKEKSQLRRNPGITEDEQCLEGFHADADEIQLSGKNNDKKEEWSEENLPDAAIFQVRSSGSGKEQSLIIIWKNAILRKRLLTVCWMWNIVYLGYYTLGLNTSNLGGDIYINALLGSGADVVSFLLMFSLVNRIGRRNSTSVAIALSGVFCICSPVLGRLDGRAGMITAMIGKFFVTISMGVIILYTGELFPTLVRNTSVSISSMSARISSALSPFLIFVGEVIDLSIPYYVMGGLSLLSALIVMLLPETSDSPLPNTLQDAIDLEKFRYRKRISRQKKQDDVAI